MQEEIAQSIVATVAQRVFDAGEIAARRRPPQDIRAYDLFLRALRLDDTSFTPEAQARVETLYQQARAIDPTFARAYTGLAFIHSNRSIDVIAGVQPHPDEHRLLGLHLAEEALVLDPNDPRVDCTLGTMCARVRDFERYVVHTLLEVHVTRLQVRPGIDIMDHRLAGSSSAREPICICAGSEQAQGSEVRRTEPPRGAQFGSLFFPISSQN